MVPAVTGAAVPAEAGAGVALLVDDEPAVLRLAARALSRAGWRVIAAESAEAALAAVRVADAVPCLVVCDVSLPELDGVRLMAALRALLPGVAVILTSGYDVASLDAGVATAERFLPKPLGMRALVEAAAPFLPVAGPSSPGPSPPGSTLSGPAVPGPPATRPA